MDEWAKPRKRSWPEDQQILNLFVLPAWKNRKASEITRGDLKALFKEVSKRGPIMANRVPALLSKVYSFGLMEEIIEANPASCIIKNPKKDRERVLPDDEIRKVWTALEAEEAPVRAIYKLFLLTGQRHDEVCGMRWIELDLSEHGGPYFRAHEEWTLASSGARAAGPSVDSRSDRA